MKSDNLNIVGPAARVAISGEADIARETQQLKVRVQPTLSASLSTGAALLMIANPIIGARRGRRLAGWRRRCCRIRSSRCFPSSMSVSGSWSNPHVERTGHQPSTVRRSDRGAGWNRARMTRRDRFASRRCRRSPAATSPRTWPRSNRSSSKPRSAGRALVVLPEYFGIFGRGPPTRWRRARPMATACSKRFSLASRGSCGVWLIGGTIPIADGRSGARARRLARLRAGRAARRALRQDAPVHVQPGRRALRREQDDRARNRAGSLRRALRSRRLVGVLRPALSGALSAAWANSP